MQTNPFDLAKTVEKAVNDTLLQRGYVNILIAGRTGVGKSTLVNAVFQGNLAHTGQGKPVTLHTSEYVKPDIPLRIYDTRGLELQEYKETLSALETFLKEKKRDTNPHNHIHVAWLCIDENSRRIEDAEIHLCEQLAEHLPVIAVVTKAMADNGFRAEVQKHLPAAKNVVRVNSIPLVLDDGYVLKPFGLTDLVDITLDVVPEGQKMAFVAAQKVSLQQKKNKSHAIVAAAATSAAAIGATPIPFPHAFMLVPIQVSMLAGITATFGLDLQRSLLSTLLSSTITGTSATLIGRSIVGSLLKLVPGAGSIIGGAISATTAAALTTAFGEAYIATLAALVSRKPLTEVTNEDIVEEFKRRYDEM